MKQLGIFMVAGLATVATAFDGVVPNAFAGVEGPSAFSLTTNSAGGRAFQMVIDESELTAFVGSNIGSMAFRLNAPTTWPPLPVSMSFFDIWIGAGVDPTATSNVFADNFTGAVSQVRSGAVSYNPGDFPSGGSPNLFGPSLGFNLGAYTYSGGDLAILMRFDTQSVTGGSAPQVSFDAIAASDTGNGWGTQFASRWASGSTAASGGNANFIVTQFSAQPVPEPATLAALGLGLAMLRRKRK